VNLINRAMQMHKESISFFEDFYESEWEENDYKLILAIITSIKSSELYKVFIVF